MKLITTITLLATAVILLSAGPASAVLLDPSYRGDPNSVHAIFDWVSHTQADWETTLFETGPSNFPLNPTVPLATDSGTNTTIILPNFIDPLPLKLMRIQLFFDGAVSGDLIGYEAGPVYIRDSIAHQLPFLGKNGDIHRMFGDDLNHILFENHIKHLRVASYKGTRFFRRLVHRVHPCPFLGDRHCFSVAHHVFTRGNDLTGL